MRLLRVHTNNVLARHCGQSQLAAQRWLRVQRRPIFGEGLQVSNSPINNSPLLDFKRDMVRLPLVLRLNMSAYRNYSKGFRALPTNCPDEPPRHPSRHQPSLSSSSAQCLCSLFALIIYLPLQESPYGPRQYGHNEPNKAWSTSD